MELEHLRALRGPNIWARCTALEISVLTVEGDAALLTSAAVERRLAALPGVTAVGATSPAQMFERVMLAMQVGAGCPVRFGRTLALTQAGAFKVVVEYSEENVGRAAAQAACDFLLAILKDETFDVAAALARLRAMDEETRLGPSTGSIVRAAVGRGIPVRRLNEGSLVQLGWGSRQRRILATETDLTSAVAESIAKDKELTKSMLRTVGVPVPDGRTVESAEEAWAAAQEIGLPVVVKPRDGNQGRGVAVNLSTRERVMAAYAAAREEGSYIIVERFAPGFDHRLLIVGGRMVAAARREPPNVKGDGIHTVAQLVEKANEDPRRGSDHATSLSKMRLDAIGVAVLAEQLMTPQTIPPEGTVVLLRRNANLSTGGSAVDVTDEVHPELAARAVDAARVVGLDIAGVDIVCRDVRKPLEGQQGVVVEVNAGPGFRMHLEPSEGRPRPVGEAVVDTMFTKGDNGRIPVVSVTGTNGKTTTARLVAHIFKARGQRVGLTCTDGIYVDERRIDAGDCSGPKSARCVLSNPTVDAAVLETARGGLLREGLGFDRCDVAIVTNIGEGDHLGLNGIQTVEQLASVKGALVDNVAPHGTAVLNAADALTAELASRCPGKTLLFARDGNNARIVAHRAQGGRAVFVQGDHLVAAEGSTEVVVEKLARIPFTQGGRVGFQVENAMAALAAAWSVGVTWEVIRQALGTFVTDSAHTPGRFNVVNFHGATVIIDYGHNADALLALLDAIGGMPHRRRLAVFSCAGDRRDEDIIRQAEIVGNGFDEVVLFEDQCNRNRASGTIVGLMQQGLKRAKRVSAVTEVYGENLAIETGLSRLGHGDVIFVQVDQIEASLAFIERYMATQQAASISAA